MSTKSKLVVILGPTGSGKSELAFKLAREFGGEIVSADSRQIYRQMDIGTDKVGIMNYELRIKKEGILVLDGIPHYMIDIVNPDEAFTVAQYKKEAVEIIRDIQKRGKVPFLVGGTGLYIQAVVDNLDIPRVPPHKKLRKSLEREIAQEGLEKIWQKLLKLDPAAARAVQKNNPRRIIRALEVCLTTGQPFSQLKSKGRPLFQVLQIGLKVPREKLYEKIDKRVDEMIEKGLVQEVQKLAKKYDCGLAAMSGIGYQEIGEYLRGETTLEEASQKIKFHTHRYARAQLSWFRRDKRIKWIENYSQAKDLIKNFQEA